MADTSSESRSQREQWKTCDFNVPGPSFGVKTNVGTLRYKKSRSELVRNRHFWPDPRVADVSSDHFRPENTVFLERKWPKKFNLIEINILGYLKLLKIRSEMVRNHDFSQIQGWRMCPLAIFQHIKPYFLSRIGQKSLV